MTAPRARILVADDEEILRTVVRASLESAGYEVTCVENGAEAVAALEHRKFDLVILDVWMPGMTGLEALAHLKRNNAGPTAIVMTGDTTPDTTLAAVREQAFQLIRKPFSRAALLTLVERALASTSTARIHVVSASPIWVELVMPCEREAAERIHDFLMQLETELPEETRDAVGNAFRELLLNAIEWGGELDPTRTVRISYVRAKRALIYRISDPGKGFRLEGLTHAAISNPEGKPVEHVGVREQMGLRPGGLGLLLAGALVDELIYNEERNDVMFLKYLPEPGRT